MGCSPVPPAPVWTVFVVTLNKRRAVLIGNDGLSTGIQIVEFGKKESKGVRPRGGRQVFNAASDKISREHVCLLSHFNRQTSDPAAAAPRRQPEHNNFGVQADFTSAPTVAMVGGSDCGSGRVKDLLRFVDASNVPPSKERPSAFLFHHIRELPFPTAILFPKAFPSDFAVIATAKPREGSRGFLTTVASSSGEIQIAIEVGNMPTFRYAELGGEPTSRSPRFSVDLADGKWHQFSFRVQGSEVTFYMDCTIEMTAVIQRSKTPHIDNTGMLTIGPNFQGELEQLVFSDDPNDAALQCENGAKPSEEDTKSLEEVSTFANDIEPMPETKASPRFATSTIPDDVTSRKMAPEIPKPVGSCARACKNGGLCTPENICRCPDGYTGQACEQALCRLPCENGGAWLGNGREKVPCADSPVRTAEPARLQTDVLVPGGTSDGGAGKRSVVKVVKMAATVSSPGCVPVARDSRENPVKLISSNNTRETVTKQLFSTVVFAPEEENLLLVLKVFAGSKVVRMAGNAAHPGNACVETVSMAAIVNTGNLLRCKTYQRSSEPYRRGYKRKFTAVTKVKCGPFGLGTCVKERGQYPGIGMTGARSRDNKMADHPNSEFEEVVRPLTEMRRPTQVQATQRDEENYSSTNERELNLLQNEPTGFSEQPESSLYQASGGGWKA
ncbi:hypothetical protein Bbelb_251530 [Branchiostoma belcheri]|nr:hypothetical protein Bbelb_251530 [Branchiostoma belcheri]